MSSSEKSETASPPRRETPPRPAIIIQPGDLAEVMSTTPLLAAVSDAYPGVAFDWLVSDAARPGIIGNQRLRRLIRAEEVEPGNKATEHLASLLRAGEYDICFVPVDSLRAAYEAWRAGIPQRIGLGWNPLFTTRARPPSGDLLPAQRYLSLATAAGVDSERVAKAEMEFSPSDYDRADVTRWLVESMDWLGDTTLVVLHPGTGVMDETMRARQWPAERFARLANYLSRQHRARVVLVGGPQDIAVSREVAGMIPYPVANRTGQMGLGEMGALCELANLYIGNDVAPTYIAAASGCPTVVVHGPTNPAASKPYMVNTLVTSVWRAGGEPFSWRDGVTVEEVATAAAALLAPQQQMVR